MIDSLYALGGSLRDLLWETTGLAEIRTQALNIAHQITAKEQIKKLELQWK